MEICARLVHEGQVPNVSEDVFHYNLEVPCCSTGSQFMVVSVYPEHIVA
jgi:hypothetical protein